jgi:hypothetical protein
MKPARAERSLAARLRRQSKRVALAWPRSLRLTKHRGGSVAGSMACDLWTARSMRYSDAEIEMIAARPLWFRLRTSENGCPGAR